ncbi:MAG: hypothetical protein RR779_10715 [Comamonas sp.]
MRQFKLRHQGYARCDDLRFGNLAEFDPSHAALLAPKHKEATVEQAASIRLVGLTA